ncbi:anti sigma factor C-terminal domain-containing protein [Sporolactobacillus inulinus]|uniref:Sigma factor regulator C-terminal domain-containing protein n=1 Tax=Sporolactobacillus inulinus CASD TaxID=1069536 RepID=A0A0U1QNY3_9BACL|nr:anti sigma factor C-terminal domain-containing protein [Sporolactobacillus inulinus]KLI02527.1 hypothetical protein SINU_07575 [Sporolactobacillus inulinus CASD]GEB77721.1 hypothetical protein SIN01_20660 [Sporolactobacillus inulinus]
MKKTNEDELKNVFDDKSLKKSLKKAKRITLLRTLLISAGVCILLFIGVFQVNRWWIGKKGDEVASQLIKEDAIMKAPNTIVNAETVDIGLFQGTIKRDVYKVIENKVIPWETQEVYFGLSGFQSTSFSSQSTQIDQTTEVHLPSGDGEMLFYVPQFKYRKYANDLSKIKEYPQDKYIEMGISFNKGYSLREIKQRLPKSVHPTWYWVNDYPIKSDFRDSPESGQGLFGISNPSSKLGQTLTSSNVKTESDFLNHLKQVDHSDYKMIKKRQRDGLIIGVVVTGTKDGLSVLQEQPYVRATSLGAVVDKY